jgi:AraC family transcriptional activator of pobA
MDGRHAFLNNSNIMSRPVRAPAPPAATGLPTYTLYGDAPAQQWTDWLHCESIAERSRRHDWEIRPHRHEALFQILYIRRGRGQASLDTQAHELRGPCAVTVPALVPHGFRFQPGIDGTVFTVMQSHLAALLAGEPGLRERAIAARVLPVPATGARALVRAAARVEEEFRTPRPWRGLAIDAALCALVLALVREAPGVTGAAVRPAARAPLHLDRYRALVEASFRRQPRLAALAAELGITPTQLNRVCRQLTGRPALSVLHARLVLEAQRELAYTGLSIKQIALGLGYCDAGYFTRFFQRQTGRTPTQWRAAGAAHAARV